MTGLLSKFLAHPSPRSILIDYLVKIWDGMFIGYHTSSLLIRSLACFNTSYLITLCSWDLGCFISTMSLIPSVVCVTISMRHQSTFFCKCSVTVDLWNEVRTFFSPSIILDPLTPQSAVFGFFDNNDDYFLLRNHILLIFKYCIYKNREKTLNKYVIFNAFKSTYKKEKLISSARVDKFEKMVESHSSSSITCLLLSVYLFFV